MPLNATGEHNLPAYECKKSWPNATVASIKPRTDDAKSRAFSQAVAEEFGEPYTAPAQEYTFFCTFPMYPNVPVRDCFDLAGFRRRPREGVSGNGVTFEAAETCAWDHYQKRLTCDHSFVVHTMSNPEKTPLLAGNGHCTKCSLYVHQMFMEQSLYDAWMLANEAHNGQPWKGVGSYHTSHLNKVYEAVEWGSARSWEERVRAGCAAILCDITTPELTPARRCTWADVEAICGRDVANLVKEINSVDPQSFDARLLSLYYGLGRSPWLTKCEDRTWVRQAAELDLRLCEEYGDLDPARSKYLKSWADHNLKKLG